MSTISFVAPLPDDAMQAELRWVARRTGLRPGSEPAERDRATHAVLMTVDLAGRRREVDLSLAEADRWLADAQALQARAAAVDAQARQRREETAAERAAVVATLDLSCPRCRVPRTYNGKRDVQVTSHPDDLLTDQSRINGRTQVVGYHEYGCPRCGSVELFRPGALRHPLTHVPQA